VADAEFSFEHFYRRAARGEVQLPWDRGGPHPLLEEWARELRGQGRRALVVGSGPGSDAELLAARGFAVTAFDLAPTAVATARERFPASRVDYRVEDVLHPPSEWRSAFDLVLESLTVQSLPPAEHARATANVAAFVAPGGTLLVIASMRDPPDAEPDGPPWPLTRAEVEAFAIGELELVSLEERRDPGVWPRWRAVLRDVRSPG
jgi:SAM-dependent methyltransferase